MRFLLRVDSHARNHSAYPRAQSQVAAFHAYLQRRAPRVLSSGALRACSARQYYLLHLPQLHPAGIRSFYSASDKTCLLAGAEQEGPAHNPWSTHGPHQA